MAKNNGNGAQADSDAENGRKLLAVLNGLGAAIQKLDRGIYEGDVKEHLDALNDLAGGVAATTESAAPAEAPAA